MTIVVGGYIVGYPLGGMTWHHLNYLLGLQELGHHITFLEDSGSYCVPYNPADRTCSADSAYGREYLQRTFSEYGLDIPYCYYSEFEDRHYGLTAQQLHQTLAAADVLICVSGVTPLRADRPRPRRTVVIDTDPVFTQLRMRNDIGFVDYYKQFDAVATFGRLIGTVACPLPTHGFKWIPTHQPVALRHWPVAAPVGKQFTTVGKWEHSSERNLEFNGSTYRSSKGVEWLNMLELPGRTNWEMAVGMSSMPVETQQRFTSHGWKLLDAEAATISARSFQQFIQTSAGEFTVAKEIYSGIPSGWFSDRSAAYLAAGKPVVTQATGFEQWLPTGSGLHSYRTVDDAAAALQAIAEDYPAQSAGARKLAEQHFDSNLVLNELLQQAL